MRTFLIIVVFVLFITNCFAQEVKIGFKAGLNCAKVTSKGTYCENNLSTVHFGMFSTIPLNKRFDLQTEMLYSVQGYKEAIYLYKMRPSSELECYNLYGYVNFPFILKYKIADNISIDLGPQLGILTTSKQVVKQDNEITIETIDQKLFKKIDIAATLGFTVNIPKQITISARLNHGLTSIDANEDVSLKNSVLQFSIGYIISDFSK